MAPLLRNALTILRGSVIGQGVLYLTLPWLSRTFGPEAFGVLQSLQSLLAVLLIVCSLRLEIAILSADDDDVRRIIPVSIALCVLTSLLTLLCLGLLPLAIPGVLDPFGLVVFILPAAVLFAGIGQVLNYLALRTQSFNLCANSKVAQSLSYAGSASIFGVFCPSTIMLYGADVIGRLVLAASYIRGEVLETLKHSRHLRRSSFAVISRYRALPLLSMPSAVINTLGSSFTALMLLALFDSGEAGNYAMIERLVGAPIAIVGGAASQAFLAALSESSMDTSDRRKHFVHIVRSYALLGLPPLLVLYFSANSLVPWLLGPQWQAAGSFMQIMAPMYLIALIAAPVNMTLVVCGRQGWQLAWDSLRLAAMVAMWFGIHHAGVDSATAVAVYSLTASVFYVAHIVLSYLSTGVGLRAKESGPTQPLPPV